jgi:hypothetical protein
MIPTSSTLRVARPTDNLSTITQMYIQGLGFRFLAEFKDHQGFDGAIIGHPNHNYHLEFTHHRGTSVGRAPSQDNLLIFYIPDNGDWQNACENMCNAGFQAVTAYNPFWDIDGKTFEDLDGYRVVLQRRIWPL